MIKVSMPLPLCEDLPMIKETYRSNFFPVEDMFLG